MIIYNQFQSVYLYSSFMVFLVIVGITFGLFGKSFRGQEIGFETITNQFKIIRESFFVITSEYKLEKLNNSIHGELPLIDFDNYFLIGAFMGEQKTGGYSIKITRILKSNNRINIVINICEPGPNDFVTLMITYPGHIVKVNKNILLGEKNPLFVFIDEKGNKLYSIRP